MRIRSLSLKNYRGFDDATLDLDRPLTVLCGVNGSGKSSVLEACALLLSTGFTEALRSAGVSEEHHPRRRSVEDTDVRRGADKLFLRATLSNGDQTRELSVLYPEFMQGGRQVLGDAMLHLHSAAPAALSVFYEAPRDVARAKEAFALQTGVNGTPREDATSATHDALVVSRLKFRSLFQWFKEHEDLENAFKVSNQDLTLEDPQLSAVRRAVAGMLPGFSGLRIQRLPTHMSIHKGDTLLFLDQLSDGEKSMLALTADLARRLAMTYTDAGDPLQGEAVVLIDEIEQHLHPAWQRTVVPSLRRTFPNCQFIITTHSAQVLSEVPTDAVVLVQDFKFYRPPAPTEGRDSNSILWEVLGVSAHPREIVEELEAISALIDDRKDSEAQKRIDDLADLLTEHDPDLARLQSILDVAERIDATDLEGA